MSTSLTLVPVAATCETIAVSTTHAETATAMVAGAYYLFSCSVDCYILQGAIPVAVNGAAATGASFFVAKGKIVVISGREGAKLSVVRDTADGKASLAKATYLF